MIAYYFLQLSEPQGCHIRGGSGFGGAGVHGFGAVTDGAYVRGRLFPAEDSARYRSTR